jgi:hypothetical protein
VRTIFGREPAYWTALVAVTIQMFSAFVADLSTETQGVLNAGVAAVLALVMVASLRDERTVAALVGVFKAVAAIALAFGFQLAPEAQSSLLLFVELVATGFLIRPNVTPKVAPRAADGSYDISSLPRQVS